MAVDTPLMCISLGNLMCKHLVTQDRMHWCIKEGMVYHSNGNAAQQGLWLIMTKDKAAMVA